MAAINPAKPTRAPAPTIGFTLAAAPGDDVAGGVPEVFVRVALGFTFWIATPPTPVEFLQSSSERRAAVLLRVISAHYSVKG
jgi:hypothetical protein